MTNIILTIDYEVFLGKHECPEETKDKLLAIVDELEHVTNAKLLVFIDFNFFRQIEGTKLYRSMFDDVLRSLSVRKNVEVGYHYHPHWSGGVNIVGDIVESNSKSPYTYDENIQNEPKDFLELLNWARQKVEEYGFHLIKYRAGGWRYPQQDNFANILITNGIESDYSNNTARKNQHLGSINYVSVTQIYRPAYNLQKIAQYALKRINILFSGRKELLRKKHIGINHRTKWEKILNHLRVKIPADIDAVILNKTEIVGRECVLVCHPKNFNKITETNLRTIINV